MFGDATLGGAAELAEVVDTIFLSVKPQYLDRVLESLKPHVSERHLIVSIAAGVRIASLEANLPEGTRVVHPSTRNPGVFKMQPRLEHHLGLHQKSMSPSPVHWLDHFRQSSQRPFCCAALGLCHAEGRRMHVTDKCVDLCADQSHAQHTVPDWASSISVRAGQ